MRRKAKCLLNKEITQLVIGRINAVAAQPSNVGGYLVTLTLDELKAPVIEIEVEDAKPWRKPIVGKYLAAGFYRGHRAWKIGAMSIGPKDINLKAGKTVRFNKTLSLATPTNKNGGQYNATNI